MPARATLLEEILPKFDVSRTHELPVPAPGPRVWEALCSADLRDSRITRLLLALRGYRPRARGAGGNARLTESLSAFGFVLVGERAGTELVFGLVGRFWTPSGALRRVTPAEFLRFDEEGFAKAAWNLEVVPEGDSACTLATETRVLCFGAAARRRFRLYWSVVKPFSGILRGAMLRSIRDRAIEGVP